MLITVQGRKTGKYYTTPVYYRREGQAIYFFSGKNLRWIKNLQGGAPVTLRLHGREVSGFAEVHPTADPTTGRLLQLMYPRMDATKAAELALIEVRV